MTIDGLVYCWSNINSIIKLPLIFDTFSHRRITFISQNLIKWHSAFVCLSIKIQCRITFRLTISWGVRIPIWCRCHRNTTNTLFITTDSWQRFVGTNLIKMFCCFKLITMCFPFPQLHGFSIHWLQPKKMLGKETKCLLKYMDRHGIIYNIIKILQWCRMSVVAFQITDDSRIFVQYFVMVI